MPARMTSAPDMKHSTVKQLSRLNDQVPVSLRQAASQIGT